MRKTVLVLIAALMLSMTATSYARDDSATTGSTGTAGSEITTESTGKGTGGETGGRSSGSDTGSTVETAKEIKGMSAKKMIIGQPVYNEKNEKIGKAEDIIISSDNSVSYAIIGVGGFLGMGEHYVAVPVSEIRMKEKRLSMSGASKEELKKMPKFEYKKNK